MMKQKFDYKEIFAYAKQGMKKEELMEMFGVSKATLCNIIAIGNALTEERAIKPDIATFTPRQLMEELARRGYKGTLRVKQTIDICNF